MSIRFKSKNPHLFDLYQICVYRRYETGDEIQVAIGDDDRPGYLRVASYDARESS